MNYEFKTYEDLADFLERLLRGEFEGTWTYDDFESNFIAWKQGKKGWDLEIWRQCILSIAGAKRAPEGRWMHPDARPHIERVIEILRYLDEHIDGETGFSK